MSRDKRPILVVVGTMLLTGLAAGPAAAQTAAPFGCRASVARVELGGLALEPVVANASKYPCRSDSAGVSNVSVPATGQPLVSSTPAGAFTYSTGSVGGATAPGAAAVAAIRAVDIPTSAGTITIGGPVQANAQYVCQNNQPVATGQSTLNIVYVNGHPDQLPAPGSPTTIPLGGGAFIAVNERIQTADSLTERVLDVHLANGTEIVAGEAVVTKAVGDICAGTSSQAPPVLEICPPGSTLDVPAQECVIYTTSGGGGSTSIIIVSPPFSGPSGGTVVPVGVARKHHHSSCLYGSGPRYALIATKRGGRVYGTLRSDRILALGARERVAGLGGNDCIDGRGGNQVLYDGNGNDRVWASGGFNRIAVGRGNDYINGRRGRDWITAGNGNDTIYGGQAGARIDSGLGTDHIYGGPHKNRIWAGGDQAYVNCGRGSKNTAFVRPRAAHYARTHGCRHVMSLK